MICGHLSHADVSKWLESDMSLWSVTPTHVCVPHLLCTLTNHLIWMCQGSRHGRSISQTGIQADRMTGQSTDGLGVWDLRTTISGNLQNSRNPGVICRTTGNTEHLEWTYVTQPKNKSKSWVEKTGFGKPVGEFSPWIGFLSYLVTVINHID